MGMAFFINDENKNKLDTTNKIFNFLISLSVLDYKDTKSFLIVQVKNLNLSLYSVQRLIPLPLHTIHHKRSL
jgi:hypothetical protein